jgi:CubicO group peptidase (beta-lactamase class C family)
MKPHTLKTWWLGSLRVALVAVFLFLLVGAGPRAEQTAGPKGTKEVRARQTALQGLDEYIAKSVRDWQVPGLAVAVVKDDAVVLAKGYGVRKVGQSIPVTERTRFALGSTTKAFTAAALAILVDEGKIHWDDPVIKHLPGFRLRDPYVTRSLTVRDLLAHRTGLQRHELVWYRAPLGREELLRRMQHADLTWGFRSDFTYQNIMYLAAGQIIPAVTGKSWDDFVREQFFGPLGMSSSLTSFKALAKADNVAAPHARLNEKVQEIPGLDLDNVGPAGSITSNVLDMANWVRFQLGRGSYNKQRLLGSDTFQEMHTPQIIIRGESLLAKRHFYAYGLGWFLQDYRGEKVVEHGGNVDGMTALVAMIPEKKLGLVILSNMDTTALPQALMYRVFDAYLGGAARDWSGELHKIVKAGEEERKAAEKQEEKERVHGTKPSLKVDAYAGTYTNQLDGDLKVVREKGKLVLTYGPAFIGDLEHWNYDTFRVNWRNRKFGKGLVTFRLSARGKVEDIKVEGGGVFWRTPDKSKDTPAVKLSKEELRKFAGTYVSKNPPVEVSIELVGSTLRAASAGSPTVSLIPVKPTRFKLAGLPHDVFLDFELANGKVKSMTVSAIGQEKVTLVPKN